MSRMKCVLGTVAVVTTILGSSPLARADWFSELTESIQTNSPSAWEGQKRGYFTGGGMSYRVQTNTVPFVSLQVPRIQAGCGGIDAFWGGFGYMNPEYLVQALQNIMTAAPAYAFKLALQNLCDPCDDVMTSIQQMSQALNSIAMDECGTSQALVNLGGDAIASLVGKDASTGASETSNWISEQANFLTQSANSITESIQDFQNWQYCGGFENHSDEWSQCAKIVDISGSIWEKAKDINTDSTSTSAHMVDEMFIKLSRAAFGDIIITPSTDTGSGDTDGASLFNIKYEPPCTEMTANDILQAMLGDLVYANEQVTTEAPQTDEQGGTISNAATGQTVKETDATSANIYIKLRDVVMDGDSVAGVGQCYASELPESLQIHKRALAAITELTQNMTSNPSAELSENTITIIKESTIPIYQIINMLAYRQQSGSVITTDESNALVKLASFGYTQFLIENYIVKAESILDQAYIQLQRSSDGTPTNKDDIDAGYAAIKSKLEIFKGSFMVHFGRTQETLLTGLKQHFEFMRLKDYYMGLLKNRAMRNAYIGS